MHGTAMGSGLFLMPLLAAVSLVSASVSKGTEPDVEMEVLGVVPLESESASLLILRQKGARTVLPIFVGRSEGAAIEQRLKHPPARRPHGPDLLSKAIGALGGKVSRVSIEGAQAAIFSARVTLQQGDRKVEVEGRPSDSVALAIASHAPIFATRALVSEAGLTEEDLARAHGGASGKADAEDDRSRAGPAQSF
jgi:bifunctional DNase/RNase